MWFPNDPWSLGRPVVVVFGALIALQSSESLDPVKFVYLGATVIALLGSIRHVWGRRETRPVEHARPWLIASGLIAVVIAVSLPTAIAHGTALSAWVRDAAAYGLLASAPWLALDLGLSQPRRVCLALVVAAGSLATVSFTINWIERRGLADLPIDRLVLPSFTLAVALFAVAVAVAVGAGDSRARFAGATVACLTIWLLLSTGTRTTLAILVIPPVILAALAITGGRMALRRGILPALAPVVVSAVIVLSAVVEISPSLGDAEATPSPIGTAAGSAALGNPTPGVSSATPVPTEPSAEPEPTPTPVPIPSPTDPLAGRYDTVDGILSGQDASLRERIAQSMAAWNVFVASPLVGGGLGVTIGWVDSSGALVEKFTADTPLVVLAKFGLLGLVLVGVIGWATYRTVRSLRRGGGTTRVARLSIIGFAAAMVALTPFGAQFEDKGTGLAIILLLGFALASLREAGTTSGGASAATFEPIRSRPR